MIVHTLRVQGKNALFSAVLFVMATIGLLQAPQAFAATTCSTTTSPATTYGQVKQSVSVTTAGTYRVWSRIKAPDTTNNSYYLQIDNGCAYDVGDSGSMAANAWTWVNYQNGSSNSYIDVALSAGTHQLTYTGKEPNVELDRVLFLVDTACQPSGTGDNCANPTTPPSVSVTNPANNTTVAPGDTVTITASAIPATGLVISKVEFYVDGTLKGSDTSNPYSYSWSTSGVASGTHSITARAYDSSGLTATSAPANVTIQGTPGTGGTPSPTPIPGNSDGDTNNDGHVNSGDLAVLITHYGTNYPAADFNHDGTVGGADMQILLTHWTW